MLFFCFWLAQAKRFLALLIHISRADSLNTQRLSWRINSVLAEPNSLTKKSGLVRSKSRNMAAFGRAKPSAIFLDFFTPA